MKYKYVFLLGRPGCGKSAVYRELETRLISSGEASSFERVDDFPKLWAKFKKDDALTSTGKKRIYSKQTDDGGYLVTNPAVWNDILKELNKDVLGKQKSGHIVFIEFSRSLYVEALSNFDENIIGKSLVIYIDVSFDICWDRNVKRHEAAVAEGSDDHLVSREEMEKTYLNDDRDAFVAYLKESNTPVYVINNEKDGDSYLRSQVDNLIEKIF